eukprot:TRINITY_DN33280_c0_g1_i1.p1 TRINITY_DN33280_c0_g1~~TRINITY_DN33280_c0_g1_i1.p1  ORF type:complete len:262 (+),score=9.97 TRINITY_DN33280_c0_g1_i1:51-836(+)
MLSATALRAQCKCGPLSNLIIPRAGQVRFRQVRISKPKRAPWFRQNLLEISKPAWTSEVPIDDVWIDCEYAKKEEERREWNDEVNKLEEFYVREMVEQFEKSRMIAFFHANPMSRNSFRTAWQNGRRIGMELKEYHHRVGKAGLRGTQWENCLHFWFQFPGEMNLQPILFSPNLQPDKLLKYEKKVPEFHLLGCVVENRILSRREVQELVKMPSLEQSRGELLSILNFHQQRTLQLLQSNQQQLSTNLSQYIKDQSGDSSS